MSQLLYAGRWYYKELIKESTKRRTIFCSTFFDNINAYGPLSSYCSCGTVFHAFFLQLGFFRHTKLRESVYIGVGGPVVDNTPAVRIFRVRISKVHHEGSLSSNPREYIYYFYFIFGGMKEKQRSCDGPGACSAPFWISINLKRRVRATHGRVARIKPTGF